MKKVTKEYVVYNFDELNEDVQRKVIERDFEKNRMELNNDTFQDFANEVLYLLGFEKSNVYYSLSYCQGDGLTFDFNLSSYQIIDIVKQYQSKKVKEKGYEFLKEITHTLHEAVTDFELNEKFINELDITVSTKRNLCANHYNHSNTRDIYIECDNCYRDITKEEELYIQELEKVFEDIYSRICNALEEAGYKQIYYKPSIEEFTEEAKNEGWLYLENGKLFIE